MYLEFYGLRESPFDLTPNPRFLFLPPKQREALSNLRYGLTAGRGMTLLVGDAGTGKTTLIEAALSTLERDKTECLLLSNPTLTREEFYHFLSDNFALPADAAASKPRLLRELRRLLLDRHERGFTTTLMIDEAQSLPYDLLEEVRLLGNIETPTAKLINVILVGQPELADRLNESRLRQLKQRISLRCELRPFSASETAAYIAGRLRIAGGVPEQILTREAVEAIHPAAGGLPRVINVACDNALLGGFAAQARPVTKRIVEDVLKDFELVRPAAPAPVAVTEVAETPAPAAAPVNVATEPATVPAGAVPMPAGPEFAAVMGRRRWFSFF